jgi:hypothetical protein
LRFTSSSGCGARDDQHLIGDMGVGDPDLLAIDTVAAIGTFSARVFRLVVSSPVLGSVTAKHIFSSPESIGGIIRCCCSSVPNRITGSSPKTGPWIAEEQLSSRRPIRRLPAS